MKYNAFISYSHSQDSDLAPSLEKALEKFAKPTFKRRALNIFRDSNDLSVSPDLWGKIEEGLEQSKYFIFFASPKSAQSHYCCEEVKYWLKNKSIDHFLVALTDGDIIWDFKNSDFDWNKTTAMPKILSGAFENEPLYVDFRGDTPVDKLNLDNPDFKTKAVLFAATLHGKKVGDMVGEAVKQHKRTLHIRNSAITVLFSLMTLALYLTLSSIKKKDAMLLHFQALSLVDKDPTMALRLEEEALRLDNNTDYEKSAINIYKNYPYYKTISTSSPDSLSLVIFEGSMTYSELFALYGEIIQQHTDIEMPVPYYGTLSKDNINLFLYQSFDSGRNSSRTGLLNLSTNEYIPYSEITSFEQELTGAVYTPDKKNILTLLSNGNMELWDLKGKKHDVFKGHNASISSVSFSDNDKTILTGSLDGTARLWDYNGDLLKVFSSNPGQDARIYAKTIDRYGDDVAFFNAAFSEDNKNVITSFKTSNNQYSSLLWNWNKGKLLELKGVNALNFDNVYVQSNFTSIAFSPNGKFILAGFDNGEAILWDINGNVLQKFEKGEADDVSEVLVSFSPNGSSLLLVSYNTIHVLELKDNSYQTVFRNVSYDFNLSEFSHATYVSENRILTSLGNKTLVIRDLSNNIVKTIITEYDIQSLDVSPDGQKLALSNREGLYIYDIESDKETPIDVNEFVINTVAFSPKGNQFLIGDVNFIARLYNVDGNFVREFQDNTEGLSMNNVPKGITSVAFSPDGKKFVTGSDKGSEGRDSGSVVLWGIDGTKLHEFKEIKGNISSIEFSHDGNLVLVRPSGASAYVYDARFELLKTFLNSSKIDRLTDKLKNEYGID